MADLDVHTRVRHRSAAGLLRHRVDRLHERLEAIAAQAHPDHQHVLDAWAGDAADRLELLAASLESGLVALAKRVGVPVPPSRPHGVSRRAQGRPR